MKFKVTTLDEMECDWGISPKQYVVSIILPDDDDRDQILDSIREDFVKVNPGMHHILNMFYFDTREDATMFMIRYSNFGES